MYLTVTPNSALDRVIFIDEFAPETVMRAARQVASVGGKGFDASVVLRALDLDTLALGFVAGMVGEQLVRLLDGYGIQHDLVWTGGETRIAHVISEGRFNRHSHIMTGALTITPTDITTFFVKLNHHLPHSEWVLCGGSLPDDAPAALYRRVVEAANEAGVPSLVDSSGEPLLEAAEAAPTILKMNRAEFRTTFGMQADSVEQIMARAQELRAARRLKNVVITCGGDGIVAATEGGERWLAQPPHQAAVNAAGAGDAVSAALVWRLSLGESWLEAMRWAAATSAAVVLTPGTADCHMSDIERILPEVTVKLEAT
jgi:1-phosphofructokinase family hexose kinase